MLIAAFVTVAADDAEGSEIAAGVAVAADSSRRFFEIKNIKITPQSADNCSNGIASDKWMIEDWPNFGSNGKISEYTKLLNWISLVHW